MSVAETISEMSTGPKAGRAFSVFERMVAWRYLRSRRREAFISVIAGFSFVGIALGVATLIIVMAVMNGFRTELISRILGINGHMIIQPSDSPLANYAELSTKFSAIPGVKMAIPLVEGQTLASGTAGAGTGALVRGIRPEDLIKLKTVSDNIKRGDLVGFASGQGVAIGTRMAENLRLNVGDRLTLISPEGDITPMGVSPRVKSYPVSAIFEVGMSEYDASIVYMPLEESQLYFNAEGIVILTLIVLVAALNIISGLIMLVKDKGRDIAILRTMGATPGSIMRIFFMTGAAIGVVGTITGVLLGVVVCLNIESIRQFFSWLSGTTIFNPELYFLSQLPAEMDLHETITVVVMSLSLSFLATIFPAWRASKLDPVQALRYE